jgi:hypothetical protein
MNTIETFFTQATSMVDRLYSLPVGVLVMLLCIVAGYIFRCVKRFPNEAIPVAVILLGGVVAPILAPIDTAMTLREWLAKNAIVGLVIGFAAWMLHNLVISRVEDWVLSLAGKGKKDDVPPSGPILPLILCLLLPLGMLVGCGKTTLEPGGAYAQINQQPDKPFLIVDGAFDLAYTAVDATFKWEQDNRAKLWKLSPDIKHTLDKIRPDALKAKNQYLAARAVYKKNPTPAGLSDLQLILATVQKISASASAVIPKGN